MRWRDHETRFAYGEEDIVVLAVRLLAAIAQAHAFEQGNKRTSFVAMVAIPDDERLRLSHSKTRSSWAEAVIALVEHRSSEEEFVRAVRHYVVADK